MGVGPRRSERGHYRARARRARPRSRGRIRSPGGNWQEWRRCASHSSGTPAASCETRVGSVLCDPWFTPAYFGSWFPFPRNDGLDPAALLVARLPLHLAPAPRSLRPRVARAQRRQAGPRAVARVRRAVARTGAARASGSTTSCRTRHGEPRRSRRARRDDPRDDDAGRRSARRLRHRDRRRHRPGPQPERRPPGRSRRCCTRSVRSTRSSLQFSGAIWYPIAYDFPPGGEGAPRAHEAHRRDGARAAIRRGGRRRPRVPVRRAAVLPRPRSLRVQRSRPRSRQHLPRPNGVPRCGSRARHRPRAPDRPRLGRSSSKPASARSPIRGRRGDRAAVHAQARVPRGVPARLGGLARTRSARRGRTAGTISSPSSRSGSSHCSQRRRSRRPGSRATSSLDVGDPDADVCIDFVESEVRAWKGEPYVYKVDVDRALIETLLDDHVEDWVNSLFLSCRFTAHRPTRLQRVRDDVLQSALARAHRVRRACPSRAARAGPTSSSSATAGASNVGARTARPTSPASARSTTACSRAASTTGASTSRPAMPHERRPPPALRAGDAE